MQNIIKKILQAQVYDVACETLLQQAKELSQQLNNNILLKREDLQTLFSFKVRGAYNKIVNLSKKEKTNGIICASAGNHAQGVSYAAYKNNIKATIVMPRTTPTIKINSVKQYKPNLILHQDTFYEAYEHALEIAKSQNLTFIHPYDDIEIIAGQGTIGIELAKQCNKLDMIFIPVGGGGLIAGISSYIKFISPDTKIIAVESNQSACLKLALENNKPTSLDDVGIFADGVAVRKIGKIPFEICKDLVDDLITVTDDEICTAIQDSFIATRTIVEPSGAIALAGLKKYVLENKICNKNLIAIQSGANMNFSKLNYIGQRVKIGAKQESLFAIQIPEEQGSLLNLCNLLQEYNITEFNYRFNNTKKAQIFIGLEQKNSLHTIDNLSQLLTTNNYTYINLSDNELAKNHIRNMIGGTINIDEKLYLVKFPERSHALLDFLKHVGTCASISLFNYSNKGGSFSEVLIGIYNDDQKLFNHYMKLLNYTFSEETNNISYKLFL